MNGLLHRLAARASGAAVTLRSDARLAYGGALPLVKPVQPSAPPSSDPGWPGPQADEMPPALARRTAIVQRVAPRPMGVGPHAPQRNDQPHPAPSREGTPGHEPVVPGSDDAVSEAPSSTGAPQPWDRLDARARLQNVASTARPVAGFAEPPDAEPPAAAVDRDGAVPRVAARRAEPVPLLPPSANAPRPDSWIRPVNTAWPPTVDSPAAAAAKAADETTEVHIHIGRIDVTAIHEPPASRRKPAAAPAPMSLDSYLAERGRS